MFKKTIIVGALVIAGGIPHVTFAQKSPLVMQAEKDTRITNSIINAYKQSPLLTKQIISVTTEGNQVVLVGEVDTDSQYERAIILAESAQGVRRVNVDNLSVKASKAPLTDTYISAKVKALFLKEKLFGKKKIEYWPVKVETKNSIVYLSGHLNSKAQRTTLIKLAQSVKGVTRVKSALTVK